MAASPEKERALPSCPRCGSKDVRHAGSPWLYIVGAVTLILGIVLIIIPPLGILVLAAGFALVAYGAYLRSRLRCQNCKNTWRPAEGPILALLFRA